MKDTMEGKPTIAGIVAIMQDFVSSFREENIILSRDSADGATIINSFYDLALSKLYPLDEVYRGRSIFPVREDDSIFLSLAAFREHLLKGTLVGAFKNAKDPSKLFVGTVVQNCFGLVDDDGTIHTDGNPCRTGAQVTGKNAKGRDMTKVSDQSPS